MKATALFGRDRWWIYKAPNRLVNNLRAIKSTGLDSYNHGVPVWTREVIYLFVVSRKSQSRKIPTQTERFVHPKRKENSRKL